MKKVLLSLLVLFASYADIFLFRIGIIPVSPAYFLIPLFLGLFTLYYKPVNYILLKKTHSFRFLLTFFILSLIFGLKQVANTSVLITVIVLSLIALFLYWFAFYFFLNINKKQIRVFLMLSFLILSTSIWYDTFVGLPQFNQSLFPSLRKGGFAENPNQGASGIKFLALALLLFYRDNKLMRNIILVISMSTVFITFSRSGLVSMMILIILLLLNNWKVNFNFKITYTFSMAIKSVIFFTILYIVMLNLANFIQQEIPAFSEGEAADRIAMLTGKGDKKVINEDDTGKYGRKSLLNKYLNDFYDNPMGIGTGFAHDESLNLRNTHNYYLLSAVEYGVIGLLVYLYFLFSSFRHSLKSNNFYYFVFCIFMVFEGLISHSVFQERTIILCLALMDSQIYSEQNT